MQPFKPDRFYRADDPEVAEILGKPNTLRQWRCEGKGPAFTKVGRRVLYAGADLNEWMRSQRVEPGAAA